MRDQFNITRQTLRDNVRSLVAEMKLSQREAAGSGLSQKTISNVVNLGEANGLQGASLKTLSELGDRFNIPAYQLLISNLPQDSQKRKQLDQLVRSFVNATEKQQQWMIDTLEMMGQIGPQGRK